MTIAPTATGRRTGYRHLLVLLTVMLTRQATFAFQVKTGLGINTVRDTQRLRQRIETALSATSLPHQKKSSRTVYDNETTLKQGAQGGTAKRKAFRAQDWTALPQRRDELVQRARELDRFELVVGRVAMVGATVLLVKELFTGESFVEQVTDIFAKVT
jgi:hypothetical protein